MQRLICRFLVTASLLIWWGNGKIFCRPRYGGILRVEMHETVRSMDPADWPANGMDPAKEKLIPLIFERLVRLDENGRPQAALAISWQHDSKNRRWRFTLRTDVKFHDGTVLTPELAAAALSTPAAHGAPAKDWRASANGDSLVIESDKAAPDLLFDLAKTYRSIFLRSADQKVFGTGPFQIAEWVTGRRMVLAANEQHWAGRPFLDGVDIQMGRQFKDQLTDLESRKTADFIEIWPCKIERLSKNLKTWSSFEVARLNHVLIALVFERGRPASEDAKLREALSLCIDRSAIYSWLLQKTNGEMTAALLPQKLSGYAFLFPTGPDTEKAKQLVAKPGQPRPALMLSYDASDPLAGSMAERIAVNAREAGIAINASNQPLNSDVRLMRFSITEPVPGEALTNLLQFFRLTDAGSLSSAASIESLYAAESAALSDHWVIPLFHVPEIFGLSPRLKTWTTTGIDSFGGWHFDDMWLEIEKP
jgi:peptide/nickel transport system substrate-binding protein